jgi:hypothetical protein
MPKLNGIELRKQVFENVALQAKCIPSLFFKPVQIKNSVMDAYSMSVQGFFHQTELDASPEKKRLRISWSTRRSVLR